MKIFLDTANLESIKKWAAAGIIDGVTTNPTHLSKEGEDPTKLILEICSIMEDGEVSVEVTEQKSDEVYRQAKTIAALAKNIVVKIPCHQDYYAIIKRLANEGVKLNITLIFSLIQGLMMSKLGVTYISPFVGRLDDIDVEGISLIGEMAHMTDAYGFYTNVLAASMRHIPHVHQAILAGADVITVPIAVFEKMITHPLTDRGIEKFNADWQKLGIKKFP